MTKTLSVVNSQISSRAESKQTSNNKIRLHKIISKERKYKEGEWTRNEIIKAYTHYVIINNNLTSPRIVRDSLFKKTRSPSQIKIKIRKLRIENSFIEEFWRENKSLQYLLKNCDVDEKDKMILETELKMFDFLNKYNTEVKTPYEFSHNFENEQNYSSGNIDSEKFFKNISLSLSSMDFDFTSEICQRNDGMFVLDIVNISKIMLSRLQNCNID